MTGCREPIKCRSLCNRHYLRLLKYGTPTDGRTENGKPYSWLKEHAGFEKDECLIWPFSRSSHGYGQININYRRVGAHRLMCELKHGPPQTETDEAAHSCGNGASGCVNPKHLRWATPQQNAADKFIHGTQPIGENNHNHKLTRQQVNEIRSATGESQASIALRYGVCQQLISRIILGKLWIRAET